MVPFTCHSISYCSSPCFNNVHQVSRLYSPTDYKLGHNYKTYNVVADSHQLLSNTCSSASERSIERHFPSFSYPPSQIPRSPKVVTSDPAYPSLFGQSRGFVDP
jgi:hypothetical protein